jgi:phage gpG-like protein
VFSLSFDQTGIEEVIAAYKRADAACRDPIRLVKDELVTWFQGYERRMFSSEGSGRSGKWRALSATYAAWKTRKHPGKTILRLNDRMWSSLTGQTAETIQQLDTRKLTLGTRTPYAIFHQIGTAMMPKRAPIDITNRDAADVAAIVRRGIFAAVKATSLRAA